MAWVAFLFCMSSGISTLNNYTKKVVMNRHKHKSQGYPCRNFTFPPQPPTTHYSLPPPPPSVPPPSPPSPPLSPLSPYYNTSFGDAPSPPLPEQQELQELQEQQQQREHQRERQRQLLQHQASMPPPHPSQQATFCPYYSNAAPSLSISPTMSGHSYTLQYSEEEYSPL